jgi:CRP-like cAMP-binding protein
MVVLNGRVKISNRSADGKEITFGIVGPGGIIGEMALLTRENRSAGVMTLEHCDVLAIERRDFIYALERNPKLCIELLDVLCQKLQKTNQQVEETVFLDRPAKTAKALLRLAKEYGEETSEGIRIDLKLSQRELGNLIGLTRESVNKQMTEWREQGIVRHVDGFITIQDLNFLEEISEP